MCVGYGCQPAEPYARSQAEPAFVGEGVQLQQRAHGRVIYQAWAQRVSGDAEQIDVTDVRWQRNAEGTQKPPIAASSPWAHIDLRNDTSQSGPVLLEDENQQTLRGSSASYDHSTHVLQLSGPVLLQSPNGTLQATSAQLSFGTQGQAPEGVSFFGNVTGKLLLGADFARGARPNQP